MRGGRLVLVGGLCRELFPALNIPEEGAAAGSLHTLTSQPLTLKLGLLKKALPFLLSLAYMGNSFAKLPWTIWSWSPQQAGPMSKHPFTQDFPHSGLPPLLQHPSPMNRGRLIVPEEGGIVSSAVWPWALKWESKILEV